MKKFIVGFLVLLFAVSAHAQAWSGIISSARAMDWTKAGLPGDVPPDAAWTQCGPTISAYGSSGTPASPSTINNALAHTASGYTGCGANTYVLLGAGIFYLNGTISGFVNSEVLRGSGANSTFIVATGSQSGYLPTNYSVTVLIDLAPASGAANGYCSVPQWPCPTGQWNSGASGNANWTGGYTQGATSITLDSAPPTNTPIVLDQCDTGFTGTSSVVRCGGGTGGVISSAALYGATCNGSGYVTNNTGTINGSPNFGTAFGDGLATYIVNSTGSGGCVATFTVTAGGHGYTYTNTNSLFGAPTTTTTTSGSGTGFEVNITGVSAYDNNGVFECAVSMICANEAGANTSRTTRSQSEVVIATAVTGSGPYTVTLKYPLVHPNWASAQSPQAWWGTPVLTNVGVENLSINGSGINECNFTDQGGLMGINVANVYGGWVTGVASNTFAGFHVGVSVSSNILVANSYFYQTCSNFDRSYGVGPAGPTSNLLTENNIFQGVADPTNIGASSTGCVAGYNFAVNNDFEGGFQPIMYPMLGYHAAGADYCLDEGNIGSSLLIDVIHGPHDFNTVFRNYFNGREYNTGVATNQWTIPISIFAFSRYNNVLANVLGTSGYHTSYQCNPTTSTTQYCNGSGPSVISIYMIGNSGADGQIDFNNIPALPNDTLAISSTYRYGNCDVVSSPNCQFNSAEVPTADPNFPNPVPSSHAFPASFYNGIIGARPSCSTGLAFWKNPSTHTCPPYPGIGPDVTPGTWQMYICTSGAYINSRVLATSQCAGGTHVLDNSYDTPNPAMLCYFNQMGGPPDGTGSVLTFNPSACYENDPSAPPAPSPTSFVLNSTGTTTLTVVMPITATSTVGTVTGTITAKKTHTITASTSCTCTTPVTSAKNCPCVTTMVVN